MASITPETVGTAVEYLRDGLEITLAKYPVLTGYLGPDNACNNCNTNRENLVKVLFNNKPEAIGSLVNDTIFSVQVIKESQEKSWIGLPPFEELIKARMPADGLPVELYCHLPTGIMDVAHEPIATTSTKTWVPVFTLKATFLTESKALVLGFVFQHTLVDGTTMATIFNGLVKDLEFAASCRKVCVSPADFLRKYPIHSWKGSPCLSGYLLKDVVGPLPVNSSTISSEQNLPEGDAKVLSPTLFFAAKTIEVLKEEINKILHCAGKLALTKKLTKTDCISGLIWLAVARGRSSTACVESNPTQPTYFRTAVSTRRKLRPELPDKFFGNMFEHATSQSTLKQAFPDDTSATGLLSAVAHHALLVRHAIDRVDDTSMRERLTRVAQLKDVQDTVSAIPAFDKANGVDFGSLATFGADLEFNIPGTKSACAEFCRKIMPGKEGIANVLPRRGGTQGDAVWEVVVSLKAAHAEKMIKELEQMQLLEKTITGAKSLLGI